MIVSITLFKPPALIVSARCFIYRVGRQFEVEVALGEIEYIKLLFSVTLPCFLLTY